MDQDVVRPPRTAPLHETRSAFTRLCERHFRLGATLTLALAAINLGARLGEEVVTDWDEALYAITAWEALQSGDWIGTTFLGELDYYNSKPPLNVWLIALAFQLMGPGLLALRLTSAVSAWLTVAVLQGWTRRVFGPATALLSSLVLSTSFGFIYVHAGRSGNADAPFALLVLLMVVTLWAEREKPWRRVWLGPLAAGLFLLKGVGVLMPLAIVAVVALARGRTERRRLLPTVVAVIMFAVPCGFWAAARWSVDGPAFFESMFRNDLIRLTTQVLEGHAGTPLFYLNVLQKNQYEWLAAGLLTMAFVPAVRARLRQALHRPGDTGLVLLAWAGVCLLVPTVLQTKLPWYLNPFYPAFAVGVGWILATGLSEYGLRPAVRGRMVTALAILAFAVAESKLIWYSYRVRDVDRSVQGLLMAERDQVASSRVFRHDWSHADAFVLRAVVQADAGVAGGIAEFFEKSGPGDYLVEAPGMEHPDLLLVRERGAHALYRRSLRPLVPPAESE
jgi:4-amino-4-deoxy-L-arabinose transferase-like glycosyltransferase